ncbi:glycosyltransferase family 4 protein, partial [Candidatus Neomarinimicrobiota bacterium]
NILVKKGEKINIHLYVAGDGKYKNKLQKLIKKYSLDNNVILLGNQLNIGKLLDSCDIFVHPSYDEGFGIAVVEAMHAGKPIIASNIGALPELIDDGYSGILINPFDADLWSEKITYLLNNQDESIKLAKRAKEKAKRSFSVKRFIEQYNFLYDSLINE